MSIKFVHGAVQIEWIITVQTRFLRLVHRRVREIMDHLTQWSNFSSKHEASSLFSDSFVKFIQLCPEPLQDI